ncbi:MAG: GntR family transcriptional regulator [Eggerthellaceae bacterium]|nr:GntR family transcriptional regulator [Eggerthellaceae bacterium]
MDIVISNASDKPIYEQIVFQLKDAILSGSLEPGSSLPSMRVLANRLHVSVITTKRAYAELEAQGFIDTVQGKGSFVAGANLELLREERLRRVEEHLAAALSDARVAGVDVAELHDMLDALAVDE